MGDVIDIGGKPRPGESAFPTCSCGESYTPLAIMGERPFIAALVCTECGNEVPVNNGYIGAGGEGRDQSSVASHRWCRANAGHPVACLARPGAGFGICLCFVSVSRLGA